MNDETSSPPPPIRVGDLYVSGYSDAGYHVVYPDGSYGTIPTAGEATPENAPADIPTHALAQAKAAKLDEIAEACWLEYSATLITSYGAHYHTTPEAILDVMNIIDMLAPEGVYPDYKGADDVWRDISREQFELALSEGAARKSAAFAKRKTLSDAIATATTQAELEAITW